MLNSPTNKEILNIERKVNRVTKFLDKKDRFKPLYLKLFDKRIRYPYFIIQRLKNISNSYRFSKIISRILISKLFYFTAKRQKRSKIWHKKRWYNQRHNLSNKRLVYNKNDKKRNIRFTALIKPEARKLTYIKFFTANLSGRRYTAKAPFRYSRNAMFLPTLCRKYNLSANALDKLRKYKEARRLFHWAIRLRKNARKFALASVSRHAAETFNEWGKRLILQSKKFNAWWHPKMRYWSRRRAVESYKLSSHGWKRIWSTPDFSRRRIRDRWIFKDSLVRRWKKRWTKNPISVAIAYARSNYFITIVRLNSKTKTNDTLKVFSSGQLNIRTTRKRRDIKSYTSLIIRVIHYLLNNKINSLREIYIKTSPLRRFRSAVKRKHIKSFTRMLKYKKIIVRRIRVRAFRTHGLIPRLPKRRRK